MGYEVMTGSVTDAAAAAISKGIASPRKISKVQKSLRPARVSPNHFLNQEARAGVEAREEVHQTEVLRPVTHVAK